MKTRIKYTIILLLCGYVTLFSQIFNPVQFIEKVQQYQDSVKIKAGTDLLNDTLDPKTFNINEYLKMFDDLKLKNSKLVYDCYYYGNFLEGKPYIFVRKKAFRFQKHLQDKADKIELKGKEREEFLQRGIYYFLNDSVNKALHNVIPADTEKGYLQYLFFREFGEQFALKWHSLYNAKSVIWNRNDFVKIVEKCTISQHNRDSIVIYEDCDIKELQRMLEPNLEIISVSLEIEKCYITWYEKTWSGIFKRTYQVSRSNPNTVVLVIEKKIVSLANNFIF